MTTMQENEVKKAKRFNYIVFGVLSACIFAVAGWILWQNSRAVAPVLEIEELANNVQYADLALVGDTCYALEESQELSALCEFPEWKETESRQAGVRILTLKLGEEYELAFYEGGLAKAYYGYSSRKYLDTAWYAVPEDAAAAVAEYICSCGTVREPYLGASSWFILDE